MNLKFKNAIARIPQNVPPIWMMRQAGRYHKHYQALRQKHSFMELCKEPELAAEVALGPIQDFDFDVSILFSDLLFPLEALGMGLEYTDAGPKLGWNLNSATIKKIKKVDDALPELTFQKQAVACTRERLSKEKSLIGFVGGPWTLFVYAVEGGHAGNLINSKSQMNLFNEFCETLVPLLKENIRLQLDGGAELVMLFDTAAGELAPVEYQDYVAPQLESLARTFPGKLGYYSKGTTLAHYRAPVFATDLFAGLGFDHRWSLEHNFFHFKSGFVQGNFDQALLFLTDDDFKSTLRRYAENFQRLSLEQRAGWVCGLGHGVLPKTPEKNVRFFVDFMREVLQ